MYSTFPPQFINWKSVPDLPPKKPRKVPCDVFGNNINHLDPTNWMSHAQAAAISDKIAFVLTENDPYFLLDMDEILTPEGAWDQRSTELFQQFPGAACEVSFSKNGLHIMGQCDPSLPVSHVNKWAGFAEFYTSGRFVALGYGVQGDVNIDWTEVLRTVVPLRGATRTDHRVSFSEVTAMDYSGPNDDEELIEMMLKSRGGVATQFGSKATVRQLWECDTVVLAGFYPSPSGDDFDRSSADAALFAHLAFWTGKNSARMDRLFRRSGLMRAKYDDHPDYDQRSVSLAITGCQNVYSVAPVAALPSTAVGSTIDAAGGYLTIPEQLEHFKDCVYVVRDNKVLTSDGMMLKSEQFAIMYGGYEFAMQSDGLKPSKSAMEAFTVNRGHHFPKVMQTYFDPNAPFQHIENHAVNVYRNPCVPSVQGDVSRFLEYMQKLFPDENDRAIIMAYSAALVQHQGHKFLWTVVVQGTKGNGKSSLGNIVDWCIGAEYGFSIDPRKITGQFNSYLVNKILIRVEEIHMRNKMEFLDTLKPLITEEMIAIEAKGMDQYQAKNLANWMLFTNYKDAVIKERDDRRFAIFFTAQQCYEDIIRDGMNGDYFTKFWHWLKREGGLAAVNHYLRNYRIPTELNPALSAGGTCHRAPITSSTNEAVMESQGMIEQEIMESIGNDTPGFRGGWISSQKLNELIGDMHIKISRSKQRALLLSLGYDVWGRAPRPIMMELNMRPTLYYRKDMVLSTDPYGDYCNAQGYVK